MTRSGKPEDFTGSGGTAVEHGNKEAADATDDEARTTVSGRVVAHVEEEDEDANDHQTDHGDVGPEVETHPSVVQVLSQFAHGAVSLGLTIMTAFAVSGWALKTATVGKAEHALAVCAAAFGGYLLLLAIAARLAAVRRPRSGHVYRSLPELRVTLVALPLFGAAWGVEAFQQALGPCLAGALWVGGVVDGACLARLTGGRARELGRAVRSMWQWFGDWLNERLDEAEPRP